MNQKSSGVQILKSVALELTSDMFGVIGAQERQSDMINNHLNISI